MKRIVIALLVSVGCAVAAYLIAGEIVAGDVRAAAHVSRRQMDGGTFQIWVTLVTFAVTIALTIGVLENIAKKKYLASLKTE